MRLLDLSDAGRGGLTNRQKDKIKKKKFKTLTNLIVFGVRLRSASKGAAAGAYGSAGHRSKRDDGTGAQWY